MKYVIFATLVLAGCGNPTLEPIPSQAGYQPFPAGYGYMENLPQLQQATDKGDKAVIRAHGWRLWAGIMQPDQQTGWPIWYSWPNTTAAFTASPEQLAASTTTSTSQKAAGAVSITQKNKRHLVNVNTQGPFYPVPAEVLRAYPKAIVQSSDGPAIKDGKNFQNNGDIMIATESLSSAAMTSIRKEQLYLAATLNKKHQQGEKMLDLPAESIVTKHMYWPVKAEGITALPVWKNTYPPSFTDYAGYEVWDTVVGIDPSGQSVGQHKEVSAFYGIKQHNKVTDWPTRTTKVLVYGLDRFYFHKVTAQDWQHFNDADKAILNAASYWLSNKAFEVGDYLVTVAMHINTKELPSWTLQSVWWSDTPDQGIYAADRPAIPAAQGPWRHYLMTDAYAVPPNARGELDIAVNPYIEGVIHPIATSCRNCHVRAGWPEGNTRGTASYQNPDCPELLAYLTPKSQCLAPLTLTDYLWIIPDRAVPTASGN